MPHTGQNTKDELKAAAEKAKDSLAFAEACVDVARFVALASPDRILALLAENEALREALSVARDAIASCPQATFGEGNAGGLSDPYPIQAELLSNIDAALNTEGRS